MNNYLLKDLLEFYNKINGNLFYTSDSSTFNDCKGSKEGDLRLRNLFKKSKIKLSST